jgi:hypothetical protein
MGMMVEAAGVELITVLIARKLLILGTATRAKKAPLPDPLYVYCTKMLSLWSRTDTRLWPQYPIDSSGWRKAFFLSHLSKAPRFRLTHSSPSPVMRVRTWPE